MSAPPETSGASFDARGALAFRFPLGQTEPVPRVVPEPGLDAIWTIGRLLQKLHALLGQLPIGPAAIVGLEHARAKRSACDECADGLRRFVVVHRRAPLRGDELGKGVLRPAAPEPPKTAPC